MSRRRNVRARLTAAACTGVVVMSAAGQGLGLGSAAEAPPAPGRETFVRDRLAAMHAGAVDAEATMNAGATPAERTQAEWSATLHRLIRAIYERVERPFDAAPELYLAAYTLDRHCDALIDRFDPDDVEEWTSLIASTRSLAATLPDDDAACLTAVRAWAMDIGAALETDGDQPMQAFVLSDDMVRGLGTTSPVDVSMVLDALDARTTDAAWIAEARRLAEILERGVRHPRYRALANAYARQLHAVMEWMDAVDASAWLSDATRASIATATRDVLAAFGEPATRASAGRMIRDLTEKAGVVQRLNALPASGRDNAALQSRIDAALASDEHLSWTRITLTLDRMVHFHREHREPDHQLEPRELRPPYADLMRQYEQVTKSVLRDLAWATSRPGDDGDMEWLTLLAEHAATLRDLDTVLAMQTWAREAQLMNPEASNAFGGMLVSLANELTDVNRRESARRTIDMFAAQHRDVFPMPFEVRLRAPDTFAARFAGGRQKDLTDYINRQRSDWIGAWSEGSSTSPAGRCLSTLRAL
ncbi:MAG: hypothetical protein KC983_05015, partial [Phycisphaerales bacterium]|nr:hypothetical protein [Phycisphaerales bacterium]